MLPIQRKISSYNHYKSNNPQWIIIHYVGGVSTAKNNVDYFYGGNRDASAHYFVDDNSIWQSVEDYHGAWHIGNSVKAPNNWNSIGIEMCCQGDGKLTVSATTENNTVELVQYIMKKYNIDIDHVVTHGWTTGYKKICPNWSANNWERFENFKNKVINKQQPSEELYRVRKLWSDASSQKSANKVLEYAITECKKYVGYSVYDSKGNVKFANGGSQSTPTPPPVQKPAPTKEKIDVYCKVNNYPFVKNREDFCGVFGVNVNTVTAYPSRGEILCRVSPVNKDYYPWVQNYKSSNGYYDFSGLNGVAIDRIQMKLRGLDGYSIRYQVHIKGGSWLPTVLDDSDFAGIRGRIIDALYVEII